MEVLRLDKKVFVLLRMFQIFFPLGTAESGQATC